jgi:hypothetical protein
MNRVLLAPLMVAGLALPIMAGGYPERNFVPPGTQIAVRSDNPVDVARWDRGRIYPGHVDADVYSRAGNIAIPRGAYCEMIVRQVGPGQLALDLESITVNGQRYVMDASGPQFTMPEGQYNNGAGLVGNIIGAIAGAAGANVQYQGDHIRVPAGSLLTFQLQQPLHVVNWGDEGYERNGYHYHHEEDHGWYR